MKDKLMAKEIEYNMCGIEISDHNNLYIYGRSWDFIFPILYLRNINSQQSHIYERYYGRHYSYKILTSGTIDSLRTLQSQ